LAVLGFELRTSYLLRKCFYTRSMPPALKTEILNLTAKHIKLMKLYIKVYVVVMGSFSRTLIRFSKASLI
jgi:hypothetical protein